ncbi:MAG: hypothetical protein JXO22_14245 [Phycisphaerae bacterium]|nr:hypothetical protein [Phycisphaerae bacterium]
MSAWRYVALLPIVALTLELAALSGCAHEPSFPPPMDVRGGQREITFAFDTTGDKRADFWQYQAFAGRKHAIAYADEHGHPGPRIELDEIAAGDVPHYLILLDGVPFELVDELYRAGHFRMFQPPSRVVCCYPAMTDLALADLLHSDRCLAYQSDYYDRAKGRMSDGNDVYLHGLNAPWLAKVDYRCSLMWDILVYLDPRTVFNHEMAGMLRTFRGIDGGTGVAYSVGSAGLGTRGGRPAIEEYLQTVDRLCEQIVYERHGRVMLTLAADHGHNLVDNPRITFDEVLKAGGYRLRDRLEDDRDVVAIAYGLVTYAELYTRDPSGVADCLLGHADVEFACFPDGDRVVVRDCDGEAYVTQGANGFRYDAAKGDPLKLAPIIEQLRSAGHVSPEGEIDDAALFAATLDHYYPDPLRRVWRAFHGLVDSPPDLIVNLRDGSCYGSAFFNFMVKMMASTHGSLNHMNSTTFVMTTLGELPPALRSEEVLPELEKLCAARDAVGSELSSEMR